MSTLLVILKKLLVASAKKALTQKAYETIKPYLPKVEGKDETK